MVSDWDTNELHKDKNPTSSTDTTENDITSNTTHKDKQNKRPKLPALKTTNDDHVIPKSIQTTTIKEMMKPYPIKIRCVVFLHLIKNGAFNLHVLKGL